ncbi:MAG: hypothetical protein ACLS89_03195 [Collinsella sp.]
MAELKKPATDAAAEIGKTNEEYKAMLTEQAKDFGDAAGAPESYTDAERARDRHTRRPRRTATPPTTRRRGKAAGRRACAARPRGCKSAETGRDTAGEGTR